MIKHASIYEAKERSEADGLRVLVMRQWPRAVRKEQLDVWLRDAGPSRDLLRAYQLGDLVWEEFARRYRTEMLEERSWILDRLHHLEAEHGVLTLLCHERIPPAEHCHRQVLVDLLASSEARSRPRGGASEVEGDAASRQGGPPPRVGVSAETRPEGTRASDRSDP